MARTDNINNFLTDVADSIRIKTGKSDKISASSFDTEIASITTSEDLDSELATYNTELTEQEESLSGIVEYLENKIESGEPLLLQDKLVEITENGTTNIVADEGYDGLNSVEVTTKIEGGDLPTVTDYIKEGLYIHYDGVNNGGIGVHNETLTEWVDLQGNNNSIVGSKSEITENSVRTTGGAGDTTSKIETNTFAISDTWTAEQRMTIQSYTSGDNPGDTILTINKGSTITWGNYIRNGMLYCNGYSYDTQVSTLNCRYKTLTLSTTYDGTSYKNYINGELVADVPYTREQNISVTIITGPYRYQHSHVLNTSEIDFHSFRFYSRELSQEELKQNYIRDEQLYPMRFF